MATINVKKKKKDYSHLNWMGGKSFDINNPLTKLQVVASSCFFGEPKYYHEDSAKRRECVSYPSLTNEAIANLRNTLNAIDPQEWRSLSPALALEKAIDEAIAYDVDKTLMFAAFLRNELHMRVTPQVIMVRAALNPKSKNNGIITKYAPSILKRLDEVCTQYAYFLSLDQGHTPPKNLKRNWQRRLESARDYELAKYRMEGREVNLYDVVNIVHAKGHSINLLMKGLLKLSSEDDGMKTWESMRSAGKEWSEVIDVMGHFALVRNLRNLAQNNCLDDNVLAKLIEGSKNSELLPFRYFSAYRAIQEVTNSPKILDALETCLKNSLGNVPHFKGRTVSLVDNSGSAQTATTSTMGTMSVASIGNLLGVITAMNSDEGYVGVFGNNLKMLPIKKSSSIFDKLEDVEKVAKNIGGDTENGIWIFLRDAIVNKEHYDTIFVYSDMQAGHGGLYGTKPSDYSGYIWDDGHGYRKHIDVPKLIAEYRRKVNPKVNVVLCQIAGYEDTILPEFYKRTCIVGGWSEMILHFADYIFKMQDNCDVQ